jgi:protein-L-isoaspartate(D-aspartate) O-methyltransferase
MERQAELAVIRRAYAKQILFAAGIDDRRIEDAFAEVRRENFLGPGPWPMFRLPGTHAFTPDADPLYLYVDQVVGLVPARRINNGQPSLHARLIAAAQIAEGEHVVHVGAGTGYYTAIVAHLAGATGRVTAIEHDAALAARAREYLSSRSNVSVLQGDGSTEPFDAADVIYVNAGVTHPVESWLDGLSDGGRLIIPLTTDANFPSVGRAAFDPARAMRSGAYFRIQRQGEAFEARGLLPTLIIPAEGGARDRDAEAALATAFEKGGWNTVTRLVRGDAVPEERCWLRGRGWCLARD